MHLSAFDSVIVQDKDLGFVSGQWGLFEFTKSFTLFEQGFVALGLETGQKIFYAKRELEAVLKIILNKHETCMRLVQWTWNDIVGIMISIPGSLSAAFSPQNMESFDFLSQASRFGLESYFAILLPLKWPCHHVSFAFNMPKKVLLNFRVWIGKTFAEG